MKKTTALLLVLLLTISLASCTLSGDDSSSVPTDAPPLSSIDTPSEDPSSAPSSSSSERPSAPSVSSDSPTASSVPDTSSDTQSSTASSPEQDPVLPKPIIAPVKPENYYGFARLSYFQKQAYSTILEAADSMPSGYIELGSPSDLTERDVYIAAITLKNDHPEIFWLPYAWYIGVTHNDQIAILFVNETDEDISGDIESFTATYTVTRAEKLRMQKELADAVNEIKNQVTATDPYGIELQLHDILCKRVSYSKVANKLSYTAYGALVKGDAVCEGYTRAMQLLLYEFGINSTTVTGYAGQPHMWNLVELDGKWYHLDVTWNDTNNGYRHTYFNLTDPGISKDHIINADFENFSKDEVLSGEPFNYKLPICNSTDYYYFTKTGYTFDNDVDKLAELIIASTDTEIEMVGWTDDLAEQLMTAFSSKSFNSKVTFEFDGTWAKIIVER